MTLIRFKAILKQPHVITCLSVMVLSMAANIAARVWPEHNDTLRYAAMAMYLLGGAVAIWQMVHPK